MYLVGFLSFFGLGLMYYLLLFGLLSLLYRVAASRGGGNKKKHSFAAITFAFFPSVVGNVLNVLFLLLLLPTVSYSGTNVYGDLAPLFLNAPVWQIIGIITLVFYCGWIPLLAGLCIRSLHEISTSRSLIGCYIIGIISGLVIFLTSGVFIPSAIP